MNNLLSGFLGGVIGSVLAVLATWVFRRLDQRQYAMQDRNRLCHETCSAINALSLAIKAEDHIGAGRALAATLTGLDAIRVRYGADYPTFAADLQLSRAWLWDKLGCRLPTLTAIPMAADHGELRFEVRRLLQWSKDPERWERENAAKRSVEAQTMKVSDLDDL